MNKDLKVPIIIVLVIAIISLGVAFAAFSSTLNIAGNATVDSATWDIVFEGLDSEHPTVLGSPTIPQGSTASVITAPTINNNQTDISSFSVSLSTPGDSITYNFKVHNRGTVAARVTNLDIKQGIYLTTNTSRRTSDADTLNNIEYKLYYTESNLAMGSDNDRDCLAPGESELVSLRIVFLASDDESVLPSADLLLDNLGITVTYTSETSCAADSGGGNSGGGTSGGNSQTSNTEYSLGHVNENYDIITWGSLSSLSSSMPQEYSNVTPPVYFKKENNISAVCLAYNSNEYCITGSTPTEQIAQICSSLSSIFDEGYTDQLSSGFAEGCAGEIGGNGIFFQQAFDDPECHIKYIQNGIVYHCTLYNSSADNASYDCVITPLENSIENN